MEQFIELEKEPPVMAEEMKQQTAIDRKELSGTFCRGCGYCFALSGRYPNTNSGTSEILTKKSPLLKFYHRCLA